ncbi:MAG: hypothetical protein R3A78_15790 [Polyangiales bacterium]
MTRHGGELVPSSFKRIEDFSLADLEAIRLILRGGSVIDWHRLNFESVDAARDFVRVLELDLHDRADVQRIDAVRASANRLPAARNFEFPFRSPWSTRTSGHS